MTCRASARLPSNDSATSCSPRLAACRQDRRGSRSRIRHAAARGRRVAGPSRWGIAPGRFRGRAGAVWGGPFRAAAAAGARGRWPSPAVLWWSCACCDLRSSSSLDSWWCLALLSGLGWGAVRVAALTDSSFASRAGERVELEVVVDGPARVAGQVVRMPVRVLRELSPRARGRERRASAARGHDAKADAREADDRGGSAGVRGRRPHPARGRPTDSCRRVRGLRGSTSGPTSAGRASAARFQASAVRRAGDRGPRRPRRRARLDTAAGARRSRPRGTAALLRVASRSGAGRDPGHSGGRACRVPPQRHRAHPLRQRAARGRLGLAHPWTLCGACDFLGASLCRLASSPSYSSRASRWAARPWCAPP